VESDIKHDKEIMKTNCPVVSWLALTVFTIIFTLSSANFGAAGFVSLHDGYWFDAPNTWGQASHAGFGDDVEIAKVVAFDPSSSAANRLSRYQRSRAFLPREMSLSGQTTGECHYGDNAWRQKPKT
jgi:hypothetical protein